jgi:hypothetical protein
MWWGLWVDWMQYVGIMGRVSRRSTVYERMREILSGISSRRGIASGVVCNKGEHYLKGV